MNVWIYDNYAKKPESSLVSSGTRTVAVSQADSTDKWLMGEQLGRQQILHCEA